ncbi:ACP S-malonyltransferase [Saccharopolyspora indica]|uniref:ACP S-malonyltransferase n=1 Tax=Saccharopolyspora indica TaxID=1229659 RepID=UPI0022EB2B59|nr:ACP S-malonyltransferase [Saccharopolyspora indica]MDA3645729.1 ACP S-malonyltransferase [Saccharopolyspora indica]
MNRTAFVFPGQGSQRVGMGRGLLELMPDLAAEYYRRADQVLGLPLSELCWHGPAAKLNDAAATQPAVLLTSVVTGELLRRKGVRPGLVAGHSLGEYAALVFAGVLDWTDALRLTHVRGQLMAAFNERNPGSTAAVVGLGLPVVDRLCAEATAATGQPVEVANDNEPAQVVVSGRVDAVARLRQLASAAGAEKVVVLGVRGAAHCGLLREVAEEFSAELAGVEFRDPLLPVVSSVTADRITSGEAALRSLQRQMTGRVRWTEAVTRMAGGGISTFVEVGAGRVLGGLCRRIAPGVSTCSTSTARQIAETLTALAPSGSSRPEPRGGVLPGGL